MVGGRFLLRKSGKVGNIYTAGKKKEDYSGQQLGIVSAGMLSDGEEYDSMEKKENDTKRFLFRKDMDKRKLW